MSWNAAESKCQSFGGDLVSFESSNELRFVYDHVVSWSNWRFYWIGLNDIKQPRNYYWVCTVDTQYCTQFGFEWWSAGMPDQANSDWRCAYALFSVNLPGDFGRDGKWVKGPCSDENQFICEVHPELFRRECDNGFEKFGDKCYYFNAQKSSFDEAKSSCDQKFGASMVMLKTETDQRNFDQFYSTKNADNVPVWLGLSDHLNPGEMAWNDGDYVAYSNWAFGEPDATMNEFRGGTCAAMTDPVVDSWVTEVCGQGGKFGYACEKMTGSQCPQGWIFHNSERSGAFCFQFILNGASFKDWIMADQHCSSIGAQFRVRNRIFIPNFGTENFG